jgi:hypothetical protein
MLVFMNIASRKGYGKGPGYSKGLLVDRQESCSSLLFKNIASRKGYMGRVQDIQKVASRPFKERFLLMT